MNEAEYLTSEDNYVEHLRQLREARRRLKEASRASRPARQRLSASERAHILAKTGGRCHICGGVITEAGWDADHIFAHSTGGSHSADNYLPAHGLCNSYRWNYLAEEFQQILKLGVWARTQIERRTTVGRQVAEGFVAYERARLARRVAATDSSTLLDQ